MVNPSALSWLWRGFKGKSVTFAALFASLLLGASIAGGFQRLLSALGIHWLYVILIPLFLFSWLSRKEIEWLPEERTRMLWARGLIAGSILLAIAINQIKH